MKSLNTRAWLGLTLLSIVMGVALFMSAGTVGYWQAWAYLAIFTGVSAATTLYLVKRDPALLERRMRAGPTAETRPAQKIIMLFTSLGFIGMLVVAGLDSRFGWSSVAPAVVVAGDVLVVLGCGLIVLVYRENTFTVATVQIARNQTVITTGPYALVRHPMYASAVVYLLAMPLALGSYWALVPMALTIPFLIWRLLDEERLLARELPGYTDYQHRVPYRLVPFVW